MYTHTHMYTYLAFNHPLDRGLNRAAGPPHRQPQTHPACLGLYKIFVYIEAVGHESTTRSPPPPTCFAHPGALLLHDYWTVYDSPSDLPLVCYTPYTIGNNNIVSRSKPAPPRVQLRGGGSDAQRGHLRGQGPRTAQGGWLQGRRREDQGAALLAGLIHIYTYMHVCMYIYMYILYVYVYMYVYIYPHTYIQIHLSIH